MDLVYGWCLKSGGRQWGTTISSSSVPTSILFLRLSHYSSFFPPIVIESMASTTAVVESTTEPSGEGSSGRRPSEAAFRSIVERVRSDDEACRVEAAKEIRRLTKTSSRNRRHLSDAVDPLVSMLRSGGGESAECALLAVLNLAVKDERNKIKIMDAGALMLLIGFLKSANSTLQEYATAVILTLTASANKSLISAAGTIPILFDILKEGKTQAQIDAITALYNLSTLPESISTMLTLQSIPPLISFLKNCEKCSKTAEKVSALLEDLLDFQEGRDALTAEEGGVLTLVELLEEGSLTSKEHVIGALLTMCQTDRCKYREVILNVGVIPGLLEVTVRGTPKSQTKARELLQLLRDSSEKRPELQSDALENIVSTIIARIDGEDHVEKAKKILAEMIQLSMEQSLKHLQQRALVCTPTKLPGDNIPPKVSST